MPIPIAHPAAVLPLRRFCPRYFSFAALCLGSLLPDVGYLFNRGTSFATLTTALGPSVTDWLAGQDIRNWSNFTHAIAGSVLLCLPVGLVLMGAFLVCRLPLVTTLPNPHRDALVPLCAAQKQSLWVYAISLLVGVWLHLVWDSFTKENWWLAENLPLLRAPVAESGTSALKLYRVIWLVSSVGGPLVLLVAYVRFLRKWSTSLLVFNRSEAPHLLLWLAALVLPAIIVLGRSYNFYGDPHSVRRLYNMLHLLSEMYLTVFAGVIACIAVFATLQHAMKPRR